MAALENAKHEAVAQAIASGQRQIQAYRAVYRGNQATSKKQVYQLMKRPEVRARIAELQAESARTGNLTLDDMRTYVARLLRGGIIEPAAVTMAKLRAMDFDTKVSGELYALRERTGQPQPGSLEEAFRQLMDREP